MNRPVPDEVLLGLIKAQPTHGYDLLEQFRSPSHLGRIWTMSTSQLYAVLKRLEESGAIKGHEISTLDAPPRVEYSITEIGDQQLSRWIYEQHPSPSISRIRVLFLSRLYIASILGYSPEKIIKSQMAVCENQLKKFILERKQGGSAVELLTLDFVISQLGAAMLWLNNCAGEQLTEEKRSKPLSNQVY